MASRRWIVSVRHGGAKVVFYHCISRVVDRKRVFGSLEKEKFRTFMRMQEKFSGCRVVSYCLMNNHIHLLVEVPPRPEGGLSDEALLERLRAIYGEAQVAEVAAELAEARQKVRDGLAHDSLVARIHERFTYRMHDLSEFMKTLMQRFTQWFNRTHERSGNLWEDVFKSVIVEDGVAARTVAAYIDLNPVRAGMVKDPADYRWSSYGEAVGGGPRGNGKKARAGLVRALRAHRGASAEAALWAEDVSREYRKLLLAGAVERTTESVDRDGKRVKKTLRKGIRQAGKPDQTGQAAGQAAGLAAGNEDDEAGGMAAGAMLRRRVRYFTDGVVIGSRMFVNEMFAGSRERFGAKRKDGARKLRGGAASAAGVLWSIRDLRKGVL
jgi:REP element-mobilizing transposase RayT